MREPRTYLVTPTQKVKWTKSDRWKERAAVVKFKAYRDAMQAAGATLEDGDAVIFGIPMPASWSHKKRSAMVLQPHRLKPDLDNLLGALFDAVLPESDCHIAELGRVQKVWSLIGVVSISPKST